MYVGKKAFAKQWHLKEPPSLKQWTVIVKNINSTVWNVWHYKNKRVYWVKLVWYLASKEFDIKGFYCIFSPLS